MYDSELFSSDYWFQNAARLKISAEVLKEKLAAKLTGEEISIKVLQKYQNERLAYLQSYMMLMGYAIENILKGYSIHKFKMQNPQTEIKDFNFLRNNVWKGENGHDLVKIANNCDLQLYKAEIELLKRHEEFVLWAGRYHIPKKYEQYNDAINNSLLSYSNTDEDILKGLFYKISYLIKEGHNHII